MFYRALWGLVMGLELPKFKMGDFLCNGNVNPSKAPLLHLNLGKCTRHYAQSSYQ